MARTPGKVGFIGLGLMGKPMALNLLNADVDLHFYARRPEVVEEITGHGGIAHESPADLARAVSLVMTILPADAEVEEVLLGPGAVLEHMAPGGAVIDCTTMSAATILRVGEAARARGIRVLGAPVSGGVVGAQAGSLSFMVGGEEKVFEEFRGIFEILGEKIFYVGPLGMGERFKLWNQAIMGTTMAVSAEVLVSAAEAGANLEKLFEVITQSSGDSRILRAKGANMLEGRHDPDFTMAMITKDLRLAALGAEELGMPSPLLNLAVQFYLSVCAQGRGGLDCSAVATAFEELAGRRIAED